MIALLDVPSVYRLRGLSPTAEHELAWIIARNGFREFVAIDRERGILSLIVASDD